MDTLTAPAAREWADRGRWLELTMGRVFVVDLPASGPAAPPLDPVLVLHGFPTCSFDWRHVLDQLAGGGRRVVLFDFVGFGLSDKPDHRYGIDLHADTAEEVAAALGLERVALVTHDMGDSVGGELLARAGERPDGLQVSGRVLTNGSIYLDLAHLTAGQQFLLAADDVRLAPGTLDADGGATLKRGLAEVFSADHPASAEELDAQVDLMRCNDGANLMPRLIRYVEDRRVAEGRYTGAIEQHASPLLVVWGAVDPVARVEMTRRLVARRGDEHPEEPLAVQVLDAVGHYPMVEDPDRFGQALAAALATLP